jgi:fucose permease
MTPTNPIPPPAENDAYGPAVPWLAFGFLLAGLGTVMLGPVLPSLAHQWHLTDEQSGWLFQAKFIGSFLGGMTVPRRLRFGILAGMVLSCVGFGAFALSTSLDQGLLIGCATLFVGGLGLGQIIASSNILAGRRYTEDTGSALSTLNFFFSFGAIITGVVAAAVMPRFALRGPLLIFAAIFLVTGLAGLLMTSREHTSGSPATTQHPSSLPNNLFLLFGLCLFLYGGLETCMTGWLTTFTLRFSDTKLLGGQSALVVLWAALTAGRLLTSAVLRWITETTLQRVALVLSAVFIAMLAGAHNGSAISALCILLGLSLAPFFPTTFAILLRRRPSARVAGIILAVSGLGAALFPWLMGLVSTRTGSLRNAMAVPLALALGLLLLSFLIVTARRSTADPA